MISKHCKIVIKLNELFSLWHNKSRHGKVYVTIAKKILEKGNEYTKKETERLERMLEKVGNDYLSRCLIILFWDNSPYSLVTHSHLSFSLLQSISPSKADEFIIKKNVLSTFSS